MKVVAKANTKARDRGITERMDATDAFALIA